MVKMKRVVVYSTTIDKPHKAPKNLENFINVKIGELATLNWEILDVDVMLRGKTRFLVFFFVKSKEIE